MSASASSPRRVYWLFFWASVKLALLLLLLDATDTIVLYQNY